MSYKKKKDAMTKEEMRQEIEYLRVEIKRLESRAESYKEARDAAELDLAKIPEWIYRIFCRRA